MGRKRKSPDTEENIRKKIRILEDKLKKKKSKRLIIESSEENSDDSDANECGRRSQSSCSRTPPRPPYSPLTIASGPSSPEPSTSRAVQSTSAAATEEMPATAPNEHTSSDPNNTEGSTNIEPILQNEILVLLGDAPKDNVNFVKAFHTDIATRWQDILLKGLPKETKTKILEEYLIPNNCQLLLSPLLNPEVRAAMTETKVQRDTALTIKQKQLGTALSALAQVMDMIINNETSAQKILKPISDACRLLCDVHYFDTKSRRGIAMSNLNLNSNLRDALVASQRDKYLFGENLAEKLKTAKTIQQSGESLKPKKANNAFNKSNFIANKNKNSLNSQPYYRKTRNKSPDLERGRARTYASQQRRTTTKESPRRTSGASRSRATRLTHRK